MKTSGCEPNSFLAACPKGRVAIAGLRRWSKSVLRVSIKRRFHSQRGPWGTPQKKMETFGDPARPSTRRPSF
jgi:hypothetical protein